MRHQSIVLSATSGCCSSSDRMEEGLLFIVLGCSMLSVALQLPVIVLVYRFYGGKLYFNCLFTVVNILVLI